LPVVALVAALRGLRLELLDADHVAGRIQEEDHRLAFRQAELLRYHTALGGIERDRRFVVERDHEVALGEGVEDEILHPLDPFVHRLVAEQRRVGREALEHLWDAQTFILPVRVEVGMWRAGRCRRLLDAGIQVQTLVHDDLVCTSHQESRQERARVLAACEDRGAETLREFLQQLLVVRRHRSTEDLTHGRQCAAFVRSFLNAVAVAHLHHAALGVGGDCDLVHWSSSLARRC